MTGEDNAAPPTKKACQGGGGGFPWPQRSRYAQPLHSSCRISAFILYSIRSQSTVRGNLNRPAAKIWGKRREGDSSKHVPEGREVPKARRFGERGLHGGWKQGREVGEKEGYKEWGGDEGRRKGGGGDRERAVFRARKWRKHIKSSRKFLCLANGFWEYETRDP